MSNPYDQNPFEVLRLDPASTDEQVVARAGRLRQRALDEAQLSALRRAVQDLTGRLEDRCLHELLTHPNPCYQWLASDRLRAAFRRPPGPAEIAGLLQSLGTEHSDPPVFPFAPVAAVEAAEEIHRQHVEAEWQCLPDEYTA
jgi:hypothetical protein